MLSKSKKSGIEQLDSNRNTIRSKTGGWIPGQGVYSHGYSMLEELVGEKSYFQIMILNATGKLVERRLADWVEALYGCLSWPDPRIWCNQVGALAGCAKTSAVAGTTIGVLAADSKAYGIYPLIEGVEFIQSLYIKHIDGQSADRLIDDIIKAHKGKPKIMGYIRPIAKGDERIEVMEKVSAKLQFEEGPHLTLAYEIEEVLQQRIDEGMNINGYMSAFLSDQNLSSQEVYQIFSMLVFSGVTACYLEQSKREPESFLPLRCDDIDYRGSAYRPINKAANNE